MSHLFAGSRIDVALVIVDTALIGVGGAVELSLVWAVPGRYGGVSTWAASLPKRKLQLD